MPTFFENDEESRREIVQAFPETLSAAVDVMVRKLRASVTYKDATIGPVLVRGEMVRIPYRIYTSESSPLQVYGSMELERTLLACVLSRNHDGFVRQGQVERLVGTTAPWVPPFFEPTPVLEGPNSPYPITALDALRA